MKHIICTRPGVNSQPTVLVSVGSAGLRAIPLGYLGTSNTLASILHRCQILLGVGVGVGGCLFLSPCFFRFA